MKLRDKLYPNGSAYFGIEIIPFDLQGWLVNSSSLQTAISTIKPKTIIEVGTWKGESANFMTKECLKYSNDFEIICIDTFLGSVEHYTTGHGGNMPYKNNRPNLAQTFLSNMIQAGNSEYVTPFQIDSVNGFLVLKEWGIVADLIYIDGGHDYHSVKTDILNYKQLIRKDGVIVCDDYVWWPDVRQAIDECLPGGTVIGEKYYWTNT